jgi:hypothetical protein
MTIVIEMEKRIIIPNYYLASTNPDCPHSLEHQRKNLVMSEFYAQSTSFQDGPLYPKRHRALMLMPMPRQSSSNSALLLSKSDRDSHMSSENESNESDSSCDASISQEDHSDRDNDAICDSHVIEESEV